MQQILTSTKIQKRTLSYEPIDDIYCQYKDIVETTIDGILTDSITQCNIATIEEVLRVRNLESVISKIKVDWMYEGYGYIIGIPKDIYDKLLKGEIHISKILQECINNIYDPKKYVYCIYNHGAWHIADLQQKPIRYPIYFDYINGDITDAYYDLNKVLEFMKNDHRFLPIKFNHDDELKIMSIPYYNASDDYGYNTIQFCYLPDTEEEMKEIITTTSFDKSKIIKKLLTSFKK